MYARMSGSLVTAGKPFSVALGLLFDFARARLRCFIARCHVPVFRRSRPWMGRAEAVDLSAGVTSTATDRAFGENNTMKHVARIALAFWLFTVGAIAADRFPQLGPDQMTPDQKRVADAIQSGPRRSLSGPFNAWLRSPELADRLQKVGEYVRFNTSLPHRLNEFAILIAARQSTAQYEWYA